MSRRSFAALSALLGLLIGVLGNALLYGRPLGLALPLFVGAGVTALLLASRQAGQRVRLRNAWPLVPALGFAACMAVRADPLLGFLNGVAMLALGGLALHYLPLTRPLDDDTLLDYLRASVGASVSVALMPFAQLAQSALWLRDQRPLRHPRALPVARGLLVTIPVLAVFAALLGSADPVFEGYLGRLFRVFDLTSLEAIFGQLVVVGLLAWIACGALAYGVGRALESRAEPEPEPAAGDTSLDALLESFEGGGPVPALAAVGAGTRVARTTATAAPPRRKKRALTLGMIEAGMLLGGVDLLFGAFVLVQAAYFFGGQANITAEGFTYAQYARRGFFELVAVSVLTLGLLFWLDWVTVRHDRRARRVFRGLAVALVALTGVLLLSASGRMTLYEEAYGFTHLRVYTHLSMHWLAVLFGVFLLSLFRLGERLFSPAVLGVMIGFLLTLNLMNVEGYIASRNIERALNGTAETPLDICYLRELSTDAVPAMLALYQDARTDDAIREQARWWLATQLRRLEALRAAGHTGLLTWHHARETAWAALDPLRGELTPSTLTEDSCFYGFLGDF